MPKVNLTVHFDMIQNKALPPSLMVAGVKERCDEHRGGKMPTLIIRGRTQVLLRVPCLPVNCTMDPDQPGPRLRVDVMTCNLKIKHI